MINVIDPMVEYIISKEEIHHRWSHSNKYCGQIQCLSRKIQSEWNRNSCIRLWRTPLLLHDWRRIFNDHIISDAILHQYLDDHNWQWGIDTLVLACTHYPLIKKEISAFFQHQIGVVDSAEVVATKLKQILKNESLENLSWCKKTKLILCFWFVEQFQKNPPGFSTEKIFNWNIIGPIL